MLRGAEFVTVRQYRDSHQLVIPLLSSSTTTATPPPFLTFSVTTLLPSRLGLTFCRSDLLSPPPHGTLHEQPGRVVWLPRWDVFAAPPPTSCLVSSIFKHPKRFPSSPVLSARHPSACRLVALVGVLLAYPPHLVALMIRAVGFQFRRPASLRFWWQRSVHLSECPCFVFSIWFMRSLFSPHQTRNSLGWRSLECFSRPPPPPSPSDDLKPPSYRRRGVAVG
jgi:hypothetical protein